MQIKYLLVLATLASAAFAESYTGGNNYNPFQNTTPTQSNPPRSRESDSQFFSSTGNIYDNSVGNSENGREYKLQDAQRQANAGSAAATAAGIALTEAGRVQLGLLNFPEAARLFGLAGMEFAQAAASSSTAGANLGLRTILLDEGKQTGAQSTYNPEQVAQQLLTPEMQSTLASQGINPQSFLNGITSGHIQSGSAALSAMGQDPSNLTVEQQQVMNNPATQDLQEIISEAVGSAESETIKTPSSSGVANVVDSGRGFGNEPHTRSLEQKGVSNRKRSAQEGYGSSGENAKESVGSSNAQWNAALLGLGVEPEVAASMTREDMLNLGVFRMLKGQSIFRIANRNYRSFSKWRGQRKPAAQPVRGLASIP